MKAGELCEADRTLPDGKTSSHNIDNCFGFDVFRYRCETYDGCFVPVPHAECPCTADDKSGCNLSECSWKMDVDEKCEADRPLPDGKVVNYNLDNCYGYEVFKYTCNAYDRCFVPVDFTDCPCTKSDQSGCNNLTECTWNMKQNDLCEADTYLPDGKDIEYRVNNCFGKEVFTYVCSTYDKCFVPIHTVDCPRTATDKTGCQLPECSFDMAPFERCEADRALPDGKTEFNIGNCFNYEIFEYVCENYRDESCFLPVSYADCPCTGANKSGCNIGGCNMNMSKGDQCESDKPLPDAPNLEYDLGNCYGYEIYTYTCDASQGQGGIASHGQGGIASQGQGGIASHGQGGIASQDQGAVAASFSQWCDIANVPSFAYGRANCYGQTPNGGFCLITADPGYSCARKTVTCTNGAWKETGVCLLAYVCEDQTAPYPKP
eukprot:UN22888